MLPTKYSIALFLFVATLVPTFLLCSNATPPSIAGGASGTEVSALAGTVMYQHNLPASNVLVRLRPADYIADSAKSPEYLTKHTLIDTITDRYGNYLLANVLPGFYHVELSSGDSSAAMFSVLVEPIFPLYQLPADTLLPSSSLTGQIHIASESHTAGQIQIYGLERSVITDRYGYFELQVPQGSHTLHISSLPTSNDPDIGSMDIGITIKTGERRDLGIIKLSPPMPSPCKSSACDSLMVNKIMDTLAISGLEPDSVFGWNKGRVVSASFRGTNIPFVPRQIVALMELKSLDLGNTGIKSLAPDISMMRNLSELRFDGNSILRLPSDIGNLRNCSIFDLSGNSIEFLPQSIVNIKPSKLLNLSDNQLCYLDSSIILWANNYDPEWRNSQRCTENMGLLTTETPKKVIQTHDER